MHQLDLASLRSVKAAGESLAGSLPRLDLLVLCAGVMALRPRQTTADGFDMQASRAVWRMEWSGVEWRVQRRRRGAGTGGPLWLNRSERSGYPSRNNWLPSTHPTDLQMGVNHLGHMYFTQLLLPKMKAQVGCAGGRQSKHCSEGVRGVPRLFWVRQCQAAWVGVPALPHSGAAEEY